MLDGGEKTRERGVWCGWVMDGELLEKWRKKKDERGRKKKTDREKATGRLGGRKIRREREREEGEMMKWGRKGSVRVDENWGWWGNTPRRVLIGPAGEDRVSGTLIGIQRRLRGKKLWKCHYIVCVCVCVCVSSLSGARLTSHRFITWASVIKMQSVRVGWHLQWGAVTGWQEIPGFTPSWVIGPTVSLPGQSPPLSFNNHNTDMWRSNSCELLPRRTKLT